jgi:glycerol-3-phosphate acyltransferase PlsY
MIQDIALITFAYLLGSVSSGVIVCKIMFSRDPRNEGSKNFGATNVRRICGNIAGALTLAGDMLKGIIPMLVAHALHYPNIAPTWLLISVGMAAFFGHLYPIWFNFKGGKGVATALGVQLGLHWIFGGTLVVIWLVIAKIGHISSLAALISMALAPIIIWLILPSYELLVMQITMSILIFWQHRSNIQRLMNGTEK